MAGDDMRGDGYTTAGGNFSLSIEWDREYVRCNLASSAARPVAGAAAIRARSVFRFFSRC